jgi:hypothetical protein
MRLRVKQVLHIAFTVALMEDFEVHCITLAGSVDSYEHHLSEGTIEHPFCLHFSYPENRKLVS